MSLYLNFLCSLENAVSSDVRIRMESMTYEQFCQRTNKSIKYDKQQRFDDDFF